MTFDEWKMIAKGLRSVYTSDRFLPDADAIKTWYELLKDLPYGRVNVAAQKYMVTQHFPPTPADLRQSLEEEEEWSQGWHEVISAVRNYGSWDVQGALDSMSERTRKLVKRFGGFQRVCELEMGEMDVLRANFREAWEITVKREREEAQIPPMIKGMIHEMLSGGQKAIEGGKE